MPVLAYMAAWDAIGQRIGVGESKMTSTCDAYRWRDTCRGDPRPGGFSELPVTSQNGRSPISQQVGRPTLAVRLPDEAADGDVEAHGQEWDRPDGEERWATAAEHACFPEDREAGPEDADVGAVRRHPRLVQQARARDTRPGEQQGQAVAVVVGGLPVA